MALVKGCQNVCVNMEMEEQFTKSCHLGLFLNLPPTCLSANGNVGFFQIFPKRAPFSLSLLKGSEFFRNAAALSLSLAGSRLSLYIYLF